MYTHQQIDEILKESDMWEEMVGLAVDALEEASARLTKEIDLDGYGNLLPRSITDVRNEIDTVLKKIHGRE